jgi:hypothetical protein
MAKDAQGFPVPEVWEREDEGIKLYLKMLFGAEAVYYFWQPKTGTEYNVWMPAGEDKVDYVVEFHPRGKDYWNIEIMVNDEIDTSTVIRGIGYAGWVAKGLLADVILGVEMRRKSGVPRNNERPRDRVVPDNGST